jgi:outer membrane autotransporter protein
VTSQVGAIATGSTGNGTVTVSGTNSKWTMTGGVEFHVGGGGTGLLVIDGGGVVDAQSSSIVLGGRDPNNHTPGKGTVIVDGANSALQNTNTITIGQYGTGKLTVSNAGAVTTTNIIHIAQQAGSTGTLNIGMDPSIAPVAIDPGTVSASSIQFGAGTGVINFNHTSSNYVFGTKIESNGGPGEVNVLAGTTIFTADNTYTGLTAIASGARLDLGNGGTTGSIVGPVLDNGILAFNHSNTFIVPGVIAGSGAVQQNGIGTTILTADNLYTGGTTINAGALQLGNGGTSGSIIGDVTNNATLIFNRSNVYNFDGTISGPGGVAQNGTGTTIFNTAQTYTGTTNINAGVLEVNSTLASPAVNVNAGGTLAGIGNLAGHVVNAGTVAPGTTAGGFGTLTVGSYAGFGGTLAIDTKLGDDSSPTDLLKVTGDTSGTTTVKVNNVGGTGALTVQGIEIVDVGGASNGTFNLKGDYVFFGQQAVIGGAYAYTLQKGADGNWYLRSTLQDILSGGILPPKLPPNVSPDGPIYHPGVGVYEAYPQILLGLMNMGTLRERVGNRYLGGGPVYGAPAAYADADMSYLRGPVADYVGAPERIDTSTAWWGHVEGRRARIEPSSSTAGATYRVDEVNVQTGIDAQIRADASGRLIGGFNVQHATAWARTRSFWGDGKIDVEALGLGGTLTWFGANGFYVDSQARVVVFNTDLRSELAGPLGDDENATGYGTSVEVGRRFAFAGPWAVTPQAQLSYTRVRGDLVDNFETSVAIDDGESLIGRLGFAIDYRSAWLGPRGPTSAYVYGIANVYREFLDGTTVDIAGLPFHMESDNLWGGLGLGGTYSWAGDRYALYGEVSYNTSLDNFGDSYSVNGLAGFRIRW